MAVLACNCNVALLGLELEGDKGRYDIGYIGVIFPYLLVPPVRLHHCAFNMQYAGGTLSFLGQLFASCTGPSTFTLC